MRVAIYCRVSTEEQTTENQKLILLEYCQRNNYSFEVIEEVESSRKTRPKKAELMNRLRQKEFDGVVVYKLDRWARSLSELALEVEELGNKNVNFISVSDNIDLSTSTGRLQFGAEGCHWCVTIKNCS